MSTAQNWDLDALLARKRDLATEYSHAPQFASRLQDLRAWQAARLARTYSDLSGDPRFARAIEFFLGDVYGPQDFTNRDRDVARAWRYFKHSLPASALFRAGSRHGGSAATARTGGDGVCTGLPASRPPRFTPTPDRTRGRNR
jgi:hypothetical protein